LKITLLRHAKTPLNATYSYNGQIDEPLSEEGLAQLNAAQPDPTIKRVYVTFLQRTQLTAAVLFPNAEQIIADGLQEIYFGECEGKTEEEVAAMIPDYKPWNPYGLIADYPGGENIEILAERVCRALNEISLRHGGEDDHEYVVAHGGTIEAIMYRYDKQKRLLHTWHMPNLCGYTYTIGEGGLFAGGIVDVQPYYTPGVDVSQIDDTLDRDWKR